MTGTMEAEAMESTRRPSLAEMEKRVTSSLPALHGKQAVVLAAMDLTEAFDTPTQNGLMW